MRRTLLLGTALLLLVGYGFAESLWIGGGQRHEALKRAVARLQRVPAVVGDWEGQDQKLDPRQVRRAEMDGYLLRRYVNRRTQAAVTVLLVCGRPGPTALHSPDVCYAGQGYTQAGAPARHTLPAAGASGEASFWVGEFHKPGPSPEPLRILWAWNAAGAWQAPDHPRFEYAAHAALYKLYAIREMSQAGGPVAEDAAVVFLKEFLPEVHKGLFAAP
jgi:hypothetical protein